MHPTEADKKKTIQAINKAITCAGSQRKLAKLCGVTQQTVSDWSRGIIRPGIKRAVIIEKSLDKRVTRQQILPDFPWDIN